jgi:hypothetical protein
MPSRSTTVLATLLVGSLAFNLSLWRGRAAPAKAPRPSASAAPSAAPRPADDTCERRLASCQKQGWEIARRVFAGEPQAASPTPARVLRGETGPEAQSEALCDKAKLALRETWLRDRDALVIGLAHSMADPEDLERNITKESAEMREAAGLSEQEGRELERAYRGVRTARVTAAREAMNKQPPDLPGVLDAARGLFADQDALVQRIGGASSREALRQHGMESRTVILAILATVADKEWDESIQW